MRMLEIHLEVSDIDRSLALYSKLFPHQEVRRWADGKSCALVLQDGSAFGLWQKGQVGIHGGRGGEHVHFAFQIEPTEYDGYKALVKSVGLEPLEHTWEHGHKSVYFLDYDGHQGEFMTVDWIGVESEMP